MFRAKIGTLTYKEVSTALLDMGFELQPKGSTGHEKWNRYTRDGKKLVVTVSKHLQPFAKDLILAMAKQANVNHRKFYAYCKGHIKITDLELT
ncbi:type II toxin-antitoxin system HicA family toxin [Klebsiella michiganensis]